MRQSLTAIACAAILAIGLAVGQAQSSPSNATNSYLRSINARLQAVQVELRYHGGKSVSDLVREVCRNTSDSKLNCGY